MSRTTLKRCRCDDEYQDNKYGRKMRVHNRIAAEPNQNSKPNDWRCTVCGKEQ